MSAANGDRPNIDELLVRSIARWAVLIAMLILAFDLGILRNYPFPGTSRVLRGAFYSAAAVALFLTTAFVTFLGYRVVSLRVVRARRPLYLIFLPAAVALGSIISFLFLAAPV